MTTFAFETITAAQALVIGAADTLTFAQASGPATSVTVIYKASGNIDLTLGARTVIFGPGLAALSQQPSQTAFADGTFLYVGTDGGDAFDSMGTFVSFTASTAAFGGAGNDSLAVNGLHDVLQGNAGNDTLTGRLGNDTLYGGQGDDMIITGSGSAFVTGYAGANFAQGNKGDDTISGGGTADTLLGGQGDDRISGTGFLNGNLGDDVVSGSGQLFGEGGRDTLTSIGSGRDTLSGGDGNDSLVAGAGADSLSGDAGDDVISVSGHAEVLSGGAGRDKFIFGAGTTTPGTVPSIIDWNGAEDTLSFLGYTPNPSDFTAITAADYPTAVAMATTLTTLNHFSFVGAQVGNDFILFAGSSGGISSVVDLVGRSLADFTVSHNLI